jgi:hypothetical protein
VIAVALQMGFLLRELPHLLLQFGLLLEQFFFELLFIFESAHAALTFNF